MEMSNYQPSPPSLQQQQSSSNVVVVSQPSERRTVEVHVGRANDYLVCSVVLCILCMLVGNWLALLCSFPAVIFSCIASIHNDVGEYELGKRFGSLACKFNICIILPTIIMTIIVIIIVSLLAAGVIAVAGAASEAIHTINENT